MTANSLHLPAKIYKYLSINEGRPVPFEELCTFVWLSTAEEQHQLESTPSDTGHEARIMEMLVFLSDLKLITLDQLTDESCLNPVGWN